jgi:hypothetical protein
MIIKSEQVKLVNHRHACPLVACDPCRFMLVAGDLRTLDYIGFTVKIQCQQARGPLVLDGATNHDK